MPLASWRRAEIELDQGTRAGSLQAEKLCRDSHRPESEDASLELEVCVLQGTEEGFEGFRMAIVKLKLGFPLPASTSRNNDRGNRVQLPTQLGAARPGAD